MSSTKKFIGPIEFCPGYKKLQQQFLNTAGLVEGMGTSTNRLSTDVANTRFFDYNLENTATSGDNRGMYLRLYHSGAGGGGEALRVFSTVNNVAAATVHGAHISLNFGTSGTVTGQGVAMRGTLHIPNASLGGGNVTYAAVQAEIYSDGASSDPNGNYLSLFRAVSDGNATGKADVDDDAALIEVTGFTSATGNMYYGNTLRIRVSNTNKYLIMSSAENSLSITAPIVVGVDDTGHDVTFYGATASAKLLWDESDDALELAGDARLDLSSCTVKAANTDGGVIKAGTSSAKVTEDTADMKFVSFYFDDGATSGDARGIYNRLYITGTGGGGESLRSFTTVENVTGANARGAHISLNFGTTGKITGEGNAVKATLHIPNQAMSGGGTYNALAAEIWSDGDNSDPAGMTQLAFIAVSNSGNANGQADVDDDAVLFDFSGFTIGAGNMIAAKTASAVSHGIKIDVGGTLYYLMVSDTQ